MTMITTTKTRDCAYYSKVDAAVIVAKLTHGEVIANDPAGLWTYSVSATDRPRLYVIRIHDENGAFVGYWK